MRDESNGNSTSHSLDMKYRIWTHVVADNLPVGLRGRQPGGEEQSHAAHGVVAAGHGQVGAGSCRTVHRGPVHRRAPRPALFRQLGAGTDLTIQYIHC